MFWRDDGWFWFLWVFVIKMVSLQPFSNTWLENLLNKKVSCWACLLFRLSLNLKLEDGSFPGIRRMATKISSVVGRLWPQPVGGSTLPSFGRFRSAFHYSTEKSLGDLYYRSDLGQLYCSLQKKNRGTSSIQLNFLIHQLTVQPEPKT